MVLAQQQQMRREVIKDPLFGKLSYHRRLVNNTNFDGTKWLCRIPFEYAEVRRDGTVHLCCPSWNPAAVGNIFEESLESIWCGERARSIRHSIIDGSYRYCNQDTCPVIVNQRLEPRTTERAVGLSNGVQNLPRSVHFVVDHSCNLACPSCRVSKINQLSAAERDQGYQAVVRVLDCMFAKPHAEHKTLSMDGSGEIFHSALYRHLFETHAVFDRADLWPNLRFRMVTNGTMMTEKIQDRYQKIMSRLQQLEVSVDAGNRHSYEQTRVGGNWDMLWQNLRHFHDTVLSVQPQTAWRWNIIVQKKNYQSLPELIELASSFQRKPLINITQVLNWGTWSEPQYLDQAVHLPQHPEHDRYLEIMTSRAVRYLRRQARQAAKR